MDVLKFNVCLVFLPSDADSLRRYEHSEAPRGPETKTARTPFGGSRFQAAIAIKVPLPAT